MAVIEVTNTKIIATYTIHMDGDTWQETKEFDINEPILLVYAWIVEMLKVDLRTYAREIKINIKQ